MNDLMIDIETAGKKYGCAVYFNEYGQTGNKFYASMGMNALTYGHIDPDTAAWWARQSPQAYADAWGGTEDPNEVAARFVKFCGVPNVKPWGNGLTFDITILESWFDSLNITLPWFFWNVRDVRTAVDLLKINPKLFPREGVFHNALDDCLHQIKYLTSTRMK